MNTLIVHTSQQPLSLLPALIKAAEQLSDQIDLLYIGPQPDIKHILGVDTLYHYHHEELAYASNKTIAHLIEKHSAYTHILAHADTYGKDFLPYYCGQQRLPMLSDICQINSQNQFTRPIYAGEALETITHHGEQLIMTLRGIYFEPSDRKTQPKIQSIGTYESNPPTQIKAPLLQDTSDPSLADIVISGGRGLGSKENFQQIIELAKHNNAGVGASRAAVDAGYISNDHQVGQTGRIIAPKIYLCFGISGAIQHLSGMRDSKIIIAIDKNPQAPIFKVADYGFSGDLFTALEAIKNYKIS